MGLRLLWLARDRMSVPSMVKWSGLVSFF